jgi:nicotinate-nucleotide adenylyltransferase (EC 2.7.7.18)
LSKAQAVRRIGILGGTFDPVHIGHLRSALEVAEFMALDELRLLPNARPPHRDTPQVAAQDRLAMVREAVQGVDCLSVDARELERDKPSYTIDTLESVRAELGADDQLFLSRLGCLLRPAHLAPLGRTAATLSHPGAATPGCRR